MRCFPECIATSLIAENYKKLTLVLVAALVFGCKDSRVDELQHQLAQLQQTVQEQAGVIEQLEVAHSEQSGLMKHWALGENLRFQVVDVDYDVVVKAFEPLAVGSARLKVIGENIPELIFVEWTLHVLLKDINTEPVSYIQRVKNGQVTLKFAQSLPRHNLKPEDMKLELKPVGWYLAHIAHTASD